MKESQDLIFFLGGTFTMVAFAITLVVFLIVHKKKQFSNLLEKQQMESNYQNQLLLSRLEVQEQSFKYFSEEIHDNVGQLLSLVKLQLYNIKSNSQEPEIIKNAGDCTEILGKAITDLRNISHTLNSTFVTRVGLAEAIEQELAYVSSAKSTLCNFHRNGEEFSLGNEKELLIFRIIQEAIANALKHASPGKIDIHLNYSPGLLLVDIRDDGTGFDIERITNHGIGLNNMHVRTELLNGKLDINSSKENGTVIHLEIEHTPETKSI